MTVLLRKMGSLVWWVSSFALMMQVAPLCEAQTLRTAPAKAGPGEGRDAIVDQIVQPFLQDGCHVGLSVVIVRRREAWFYNFGSTSRTTRTKPTTDSVYEIASVTKTFTGALAAKALLRDHMQLDADFRQYLPEQYPNLQWQGRPITLRNLATHTSGLPRDLPDTDDLYAHRDPETLPSKLIARESGFDRARYLEELHKVALRSQPEMKENYSNLGFKVIGWGLEHVYGIPFERLLQEQILQPLRMSSTGFVPSSNEQSRLVNGYSPAGRLMPNHLRNAGAAYGLYSTPRDMAKYVEWQLDEVDPEIMLAHEPIEGDGHSGKALVWNLGTLDGSRALWHGGGTFGMSSQVVLFPGDHEGYVLLANDTCDGTENALKNLALALHERLRLSARPTPGEFRP
jgi:serine-type D-Ala-D-Ala carboxypeptidase/endopeptidase